MKPLSIRSQLSLMVSLLVLVIIAVLSVVAYIEFEESLLGNIDATLRVIGAGMRIEFVEEEESEEKHEAEFRAIMGYGTSEYPSQCRVWMEGSPKDIFTHDAASTPLARGLLEPPAEEQPDVGEFSLFNITSGEGSGRKDRLRAMWMRENSSQGIVNILVARSSTYAYHELGEFLRVLLVFGGSMTFVALFLTPKIISWGLRSISQAGGQLDQVTHRSLECAGRIMGSVPVELRPFRSALDGMLARLNTAMRQQEQFTADAAHELRTPLAVMKSTLQTLQIRPRAVVEYQEAVNDTLRDIGRMEQLVEQLLTLARLDVSDKVSDPAEMRLDVLLQSLVDVFTECAEQQGTRVAYANGTPVSVQGNETELWQLFSNLLDNALRYGPPKGIVRITLQDGPGPWVTACVHDEGGAIPPEKLPHLFDRFYRVDSSRSQVSGGAGLGLAIAREIVLRHHGDITITSDSQTGTSVIVHLPRK